MQEFNGIQKSYIWLDSFAGLTKKNIQLLLDKFGSALELIKNFRYRKGEITAVIGGELYCKMEEVLNGEYLNPILSELVKKGIGVITCEDKNYPEALLPFDDKPFLLYTLGDVSLLKTPMITVVGSRKCTRYGREQTEELVKGLCAGGFTVVSGLAEGIDCVANSTALAYGKTVAVLAGGFSRVYPKVNLELFEAIVKKGLVLSEYSPNRVPLSYMFPLRNRIMAAISLGTVVSEAGEKSGALITANLALDYGKELFVLPSNVNSPCAKGSNSLIKEMQGTIITDYTDILQRLGVTYEEKKEVNAPDLTKEESVIYNMLKVQEEHIDDIIANTKLDINRVNSILTLLEIKGIIKKLPGNRYGV